MSGISLDSFKFNFPQFNAENFNRIQNNFGLGMRKAAVWTNDNAVTPVMKAIRQLVHAVFVTFPEWASKTIIKPTKEIIKKAADWTDTNVLSPLGQKIKNAAKTIYVESPKFIHQKILFPIGNAFKKVAVLADDHVVTPVVQAVMKETKMVYYNGIVPTVNFINEKRKWTHEQVIIPAQKAVNDFFNETLPSAIDAVKAKLT